MKAIRSTRRSLYSGVLVLLSMVLLLVTLATNVAHSFQFMVDGTVQVVNRTATTNNNNNNNTKNTKENEISLSGSKQTLTTLTGDNDTAHVATTEETSQTIIEPSAVVVDKANPRPPQNNNKSNNDWATLPYPNRVMEQYIQWHSVDTIDTADPHRQYALVYYYCPKRAGNILHSLFVSVTWAMIHNRTLLFQYDTDFSNPNTEEECQAVLERAPWIARWQDFAHLLPEPVPIAMERHRWPYDRHHKVVLFPMIPDVMSKHEQFFRHDWRADPKYKRETMLYIKDMGEEAMERAGMMYYYGTDYLLGMLFDTLFTIRVAVDDPYPNATFSLALHSRHTVVGDDGSFVSDEIRCLQQLLPSPAQDNVTTNPETCVVHLMSDRPKTVQLLQEWLQHQHGNCIGVSRLALEDDHDAAMTSRPVTDEHGPHPGIGFIQDLSLASHARTGLIGDTERSSFMLLVELVTYYRRMQEYNQQKEISAAAPPPPSRGNDDLLLRCKLPGRYGAGYNYGPGTPTFRAAHHRQPLPPLQVLEQYQAQSSSSGVVVAAAATTSAGDTTKYALTTLPCRWNAASVVEFENDLLRAILTNRTLLWKYDESNRTASECDTYLRVEKWLTSYGEWVLNKNDSLASPVDDDYDRLIVFPKLDRLLSHASIIETFSLPRSQRDMLDKLYHEGVDFLYGMLFEKSFFARALVRAPSDQQPKADPLAFTVAVHGDNTKCFDRIVSNQSAPCHIFFVENKGSTPAAPSQCSTFHLNAAEAESDDPSLQFLQGMMYVTERARSGFVSGPYSSQSSDLIRQRIEFLRRQEVWKLGRIPPILPHFWTCEDHEKHHHV